MRTVYVGNHQASRSNPTKEILVANANSQVESAHALNKVGNRKNYDMYKAQLASQSLHVMDKVQFQDNCDDGELHLAQRSRDDIVQELQDKRQNLMKQQVPCLRYLNPHARLPKEFGLR